MREQVDGCMDSWMCVCCTRGEMRRELLGSEEAGPNALCFINVHITFRDRSRVQEVGDNDEIRE